MHGIDKMNKDKNTETNSTSIDNENKPLNTDIKDILSRAPKETLEDIIDSVEGPMLDSEEEISIPEEGVVPPISFEGLPEYNVIKEYVNYMSTVSDTYPEYSLQNAFAGLSALVQRRLFFGINGSDQYTNLILLNLGQSGYARKSSSMGPMHKILNKAVGDTFLSADATPEGLLSEMADYIETFGQNSEPIEPQENNTIRKALCILWKDEASQFYAQLNKPHMQSFKEMICHLYDCPDNYEKQLSSKHITINDVYFGMNLSTTPASFYRNIGPDDIGSGFLARHGIVFPNYPKDRKDITQNTTKNFKHEQHVADTFKLINGSLPENSIRVNFGDESMRILNEWAKEREEYFVMDRDESMGSFFSRFQVTVLKMAILIELGNYPYLLYKESKKNNGNFDTGFSLNSKGLSGDYLNEEEREEFKDFIKTAVPDYKLIHMKVSSESLMYAIKLHDEVYIPYTQIVCNDSGINMSNLNSVSVVIKVLKSKQKMDFSTLLRNCNIKSSELNEVLDSLKEGEIIEEHKIKTGGKPKRVFVFIPSKVKKLNFSPVSEPEHKDHGLLSFIVNKKIEPKTSSIKINVIKDDK